MKFISRPILSLCSSSISGENPLSRSEALLITHSAFSIGMRKFPDNKQTTIHVAIVNSLVTSSNIMSSNTMSISKTINMVSPILSRMERWYCEMPVSLSVSSSMFMITAPMAHTTLIATPKPVVYTFVSTPKKKLQRTELSKCGQIYQYDSSSDRIMGATVTWKLLTQTFTVVSIARLEP